jgi:hypothetical protein
MLSHDLKGALKPSLWAYDSLGFEADPWQAEVLDSTAKKVLLCCARQSGKSSVSSILALHTALFYPGALVLMVSPSLRQSSELFKKFSSYLDLLSERPVRAEDTRLSLRLENGSRVVSLPGSEATIRGFSSVSLLIVDEAARVEDDLYYSVRPMLAVSGGRLLALSTPFGKRGWFFKEWSEGIGWHKHAITALQCPRISKEFLEEERLSMPVAWFAAEYMCEFTEGTDSVFSYEHVMAAVAEDVEPLDLGGDDDQILCRP